MVLQLKKGVCPLQQTSCKLGDSPTHFPLLRYELRNPEVTTALDSYVQKRELSLDRPPLFLARIISLEIRELSGLTILHVSHIH